MRETHSGARSDRRVDWTPAFRNCHRILVALFGAAGIFSPLAETGAQASGTSSTAAATANADPIADLQLWFYHGTRGAAGFVVPADAGKYRALGGSRMNAELPVGSTVCVGVVNGHPLNYTYTFGVRVDSTAGVLPDFSKQVGLLAGILPKPVAQGDKPVAVATGAARKPAATGEGGAPSPAPAWAQTFLDYVARVRDSLQTDVVRAREIAKASDEPESLQDLAAGGGLEAKRGFRFAQETLRKLPGGKGRFNDSNLKETLDGWAAEARKAVEADPVGQTAVSAVAAYAEALRLERNRVFNAFDGSDGIPQVCENVRKGETVLTLSIARKDTSQKTQRLSGVTPFRIVNAAPYKRAVVSLAPVALGASQSGAGGFAVENGRVIDAKENVSFRVGAVLAVNVLAFDRSKLSGLSAGLGLAADTDRIRDLFFAVMVDAGESEGRQPFRAGLGVGSTWGPTRVNGYSIGAEYPESAGDIGARVRTGPKPAWYLVFAVPGLALR